MEAPLIIKVIALAIGMLGCYIIGYYHGDTNAR